MKLYGVYLSPFARRVAAALISRDIAFEHEALNGYASPERASALSPVGKVPVLVLADGEAIWDSAAILDHLNETFGPDRALLPPAGRPRRDVLRAAAIATTLYEQCTAAYFEARRAAGPDAALISQLDARVLSGFAALDQAPALRDRDDAGPADLATISAIVAFDYVGIARPHLDAVQAAPGLAALARSRRLDPAFALTQPEGGA